MSVLLPCIALNSAYRNMLVAATGYILHAECRWRCAAMEVSGTNTVSI